MQVVKHHPQPAIGDRHATGLKPATQTNQALSSPMPLCALCCRHVARHGCLHRQSAYGQGLELIMRMPYPSTTNSVPTLHFRSDGCLLQQHELDICRTSAVTDSQCSLGGAPHIIKQADERHLFDVAQQLLPEVWLITFSGLFLFQQVHPGWEPPWCCCRPAHSKIHRHNPRECRL